jgi:hypothetical protein
LDSPPHSFEQATDVIRVVGDTELALDDVSDASAGPDIASEAEGRGSAGKKGRKLSELVRRETGRSTGREAGVEGVHTSVAGTLEPLTNGALSDAKSFSNLVLLPPVQVQFPGAEATAFAPIFWPSIRLHERNGSMIVATILDLYAVVSN